MGTSKGILIESGEINERNYRKLDQRLNKNKRNFSLAALLFVVFLLYTEAVCMLDVQPIGVDGSEVGLATINRKAWQLFGCPHEGWYTLTQVLGLLAIMVAAGFAVLGMVQLRKRKWFTKVDIDIYILGAFYLVVIFLYYLFTKVDINFRPMIIDGELEQSYPSSHTMLVICVMSTAMMQAKNRIFNLKTRKAVYASATIIMILMIVGRMICGAHWFTDIIGSIIISSSLVMFYYAAVKFAESKKQKTGKHSK